MNHVRHVASSSGFAPGPAYASPGTVSNMGSVILDDKIISKAHMWMHEFDRLGVHGGVQKMLQTYFDENVRAGVQGATGPVVSPEQFTTTALIPLLITHTGLLMNTRQTGALKALTKLMSVVHLPETTPMNRVEFILRFRNYGQMLAQRGKMTSKVGGVASTSQDITLTMERYVAGFVIGERELFLDTDPSEVIHALSEKMQSLETIWGLTVVHLHAAYASRQPSIVQRMLMGQPMLHQPENNLMARMTQVFFTEHLTCGGLNRSVDNMYHILTSLSEILRQETSEFIVVVPQLVGMYSHLKTRKVRVRGSPVRYTYNGNRPSGMDGYMTFGRVNVDASRDPLATSKAARTARVTGGRSIEDTVIDVGPEEMGPDDVEVDAVDLYNGQTCYLIVVDGTVFDNDESCDGPLIQNGVKKLFFTVGACPDAYAQAAGLGFFGAATASGVGITPKNVADHSPNVSYFMDYDNNAVAKITSRDLHRLVVDAELFDPVEAYRAWVSHFSDKDLVGYVNEEATAALVEEAPDVRRRSPLMMYETNPRMMWIKVGLDVPLPVKFGLSGGQEFIYMVPRHVLGNASPCSDFRNEMVGAVGSLAHVVRDSLRDLTDLLAVISKELPNADVAQIRQYRQVRQPLTVTDMVHNLQLVGSNLGILSDPTCQVVFLELMGAANVALMDQAVVYAAYQSASANLAQGAPALPVVAQPSPELTALLSDKNGALASMSNLIMCAVRDVSTLVDTVYKSHEYNYIMRGESLVVIPPSVPQKYHTFLKFMYGIAMPAVTKNLAIVNAAGLAGNPIVPRNVCEPCTVLSHGTGVFVAEGAEVAAGDAHIEPYVVNAGVRQVCLMRPLFRQRYLALLKAYAGNPTVKALALMHYWTMYDADTMAKHMDRIYYSGLAYIVVRHLKFRGHMIVGMPVSSARLLVGNRAAAYPMSSWQNTEFKQTMDLAIAPMDLTSIGISCPNVYLDELRGLGGCWDVQNPDCALVFDSYNDFLPEGLTNYQPERGLLSVHGRYGGVSAQTQTEVDPVLGLFCQLPTAFMKTSHLFKMTKEKLNNIFAEDSSVAMMDKAISVESFIASIPGHVYAGIEKGIPPTDIVQQTITSGRRAQSIFTPNFGGMFTDDYTVGVGSSALLRAMPGENVGINVELTPRISSIGGLNPNAAFGQKSSDPKFLNAFLRQINLNKSNMSRSF